MKTPNIADNKPTGIDLTEGKTYDYCTCGNSANQPFCDGKHKGTEFAPKAFTAEKDGVAYLCQCKQSANAPFCDGSHKKITNDQVAT